MILHGGNANHWNGFWYRDPVQRKALHSERNAVRGRSVPDIKSMQELGYVFQFHDDSEGPLFQQLSPELGAGDGTYVSNWPQSSKEHASTNTITNIEYWRQSLEIGLLSLAIVLPTFTNPSGFAPSALVQDRTSI